MSLRVSVPLRGKKIETIDLGSGVMNYEGFPSPCGVKKLKHYVEPTKQRRR